MKETVKNVLNNPIRSEEAAEALILATGGRPWRPALTILMSYCETMN